MQSNGLKEEASVAGVLSHAIAYLRHTCWNNLQRGGWPQTGHAGHSGQTDLLLLWLLEFSSSNKNTDFFVWIFPTCLEKGEYTVLHTSIIRYLILIWPTLIFKIHINNYVSFSALLLYLSLRTQFLDQFSFSIFVLLLGYLLNRFGMPKIHNFTFLLKNLKSIVVLHQVEKTHECLHISV